jgi:hypothetical protein
MVTTDFCSQLAMYRMALTKFGLAKLPVSGCIGWLAGILDLDNVAPGIGL